MRGKSVAQRVSRQARILVDLVEKPLHRVLNRAHRHSLAAIAQKKSRPVAGRTDREIGKSLQMRSHGRERAHESVARQQKGGGK
jgi:hypothetical protein